jgi:polysaccharide pyruvyl transferase WcaK-like protein
MDRAGGRKTICFYGHFGSPNFGNESSLLAILCHLRRLLPEASVVCACTGPAILIDTQDIEAVPIHRVFLERWTPRTPLISLLRRVLIGLPSELWRILDVFKILKRADALIIPGTGLLTDAFGLMSWGPYNLFKWSLIARMCGCKVLFVSVGAGPIYSALGRYFVKTALSLASFTSFRDNPSLGYAKHIGVKIHSDRVYPDLVFSLPETMLPLGDDKKGNRSVVGLGIMPYAGKYSVAEPRDAVYRGYLTHLVTFVRWLLVREYDIRFLIGEKVIDETASEEFKSLLIASSGEYEEQRVFDQPAHSLEELLTQIAACDIVVATRFHNVLLALLLNKPVIAISFHHKSAALMEQMGLSEYCHDINQMDADKLVEQFRDVKKNAEKLKALIRQQVEESRRALDEQYNLIFKML